MNLIGTLTDSGAVILLVLVPHFSIFDQFCFTSKVTIHSLAYFMTTTCTYTIIDEHGWNYVYTHIDTAIIKVCIPLLSLVTDSLPQIVTWEHVTEPEPIPSTLSGWRRSQPTSAAGPTLCSSM